MRGCIIFTIICLDYFMSFTYGVGTEFNSYNHTDNRQELNTSKQVTEYLDGQSTLDDSGHVKEDINNLKYTSKLPAINISKMSIDTFPKQPSSCREICGKKRNFPCSCDLKCLVYKNCCEDMSLVCPEVLQESRIRYGHMLDMKVECTKEDSFVITSCGNRHATTRQELDLNQDTLDTSSLMNTTSTFVTTDIRKKISNSIITTTSQLPTKQPVKDIHDIIDIINNAYVTDTVTGFTYKNMEIFSCAAGELANPVKWTVHFVTDHVLNPTSLDDILQNINDFYYAPPNNIDFIFHLPVCYYDSIGSCSDEMMKDDLYLLYKCQQFISYVITKQTTYNNRYCQMCNKDLENRYYTQQQKHGFSFSLTMTLSGRSIKIQPSIFNFAKLASWANIACQLPESDSRDLLSARELCERNCSPGTITIDDGRCMYVHNVAIAVSDDNYPLTVQELENFPDFVRCFMKSHSELMFEDYFSPTIRMFDNRLQVNLYASLAYVLFPTIEANVFSKSIGSAVFLIAKVFKAYRTSTMRASRQGIFWNNSLDLIYLYSKTNLNMLYVESTRLDTADDDKMNTTVFCIYYDMYEPFDNVFMGPAYEVDFRCSRVNISTEDDQILNKYLDSNCFSVFNEYSNVGGLQLHSSDFLYIFFSCAILFIFN